jgi:hypothetical protein
MWTGDELPPYAAACLASFPRMGHNLTLYVYTAVENVPSNVKIADANTVIDRRKIEQFATAGKYSLFSDWFRFELLRKNSGACWVDTDVYCLRPIPAEPFIFGREDDRCIAIGLLALPAENAVLSKLCEMFRQNTFVPPWLPVRYKIPYRLSAALGRPVPRENFPWGVWGPRAFTWYAHQYRIEEFAKPATVFYPIHFSEIENLFDPLFDLEARISPATKTVHLWNELLRRRKDRYDPPEGSLLWKLLTGQPVVRM